MLPHGSPQAKPLLFDPSPDLNGSSPLSGSRWTRETGKAFSENEIHFADPVPQPLLSTRANWRVENKSFTHFSRGETGHLSKCLKSDAPRPGSGKEMSRLPVQYRPGQTVTNWHVPTVEHHCRHNFHPCSSLRQYPRVKALGINFDLMDFPDVFI